MCVASVRSLDSSGFRAPGSFSWFVLLDLCVGRLFSSVPEFSSVGFIQELCWFELWSVHVLSTSSGMIAETQTMEPAGVPGGTGVEQVMLASAFQSDRRGRMPSAGPDEHLRGAGAVPDYTNTIGQELAVVWVPRFSPLLDTGSTSKQVQSTPSHTQQGPSV